MSKEKIISIITVVKNDKANILKTISSVIDQKGANIEYIIIDGISTDGTLDIIRQFSDKIDVIVSERDMGIYDAMNKGIRKANGAYLYFLNSGDYLESDILSKVVDTLLSTPDTDVLYGDVLYQFCYKDKKAIMYLKAEKDFTKLYNGMIFCHQASFTKSYLLKNREYNTRYKFAADYDFFISLLKGRYSFFYLNIPIAHYSEGGYSSYKYKLEFEYFLIQYRNGYRVSSVLLLLKKTVKIILYKLYIKAFEIFKGKEYVFDRRVRKNQNIIITS